MIMRKCVFVVLFLFVYQVSIAQEKIKSFDIIIFVDEEIVTSLSKPVIIAKEGKSVLKRIDISYHVGNLSLSAEDYYMIFSNQEKTLFIQFDYYQYSSRDKQQVYNYEIEIGKNWLKQTFVVLKIYNLDKKKYKKRFAPLSKDKNYTFELSTSEGQMLRIKEN
jgi:hypothetical protein